MADTPLVPRLARDHPGFFKVALSLILVHVGLAVDGAFGVHKSPSFRVISDFLGGNLWTMVVVHAVIAVLMVCGLYLRERFVLVRYGCGLSLVLFNVLAVGFIFAAVQYGLSYYSAIASVTLSLSSLAALKEPPIQLAVRS